MLFASLFFMGCQAEEQQSTAPPSEGGQEQSFVLNTEGLGAYSQTEESWYDEESGAHLTAISLQRPSTSDIPSKDRGLSRIFFFLNDVTEPSLVIDKAGGYHYSYDVNSEHYTVTFLVQYPDFSKSEVTFSLREGSHILTPIYPGTDSISDLNKSACRFNRKLLDYAASNLHQRIGDGECWTLVDFALKNAAAHAPIYYRFGNEIGSGDTSDLTVLSIAKPGDIIQFDSGQFIDGNGYETVAGYPNHTAIIRSINGNQVTVFEQNSPIGDPVNIGIYNFEHLQSGSFDVYRSFPDIDSPQSPHCDIPAGNVNAYDAFMGTDSYGDELLQIALGEKPDFVAFEEYCQYRCDSLALCDGYLQMSNACILKAEGDLYQSGENRFMAKVRD